MTKIIIWYSIVNCGDGSVGLNWFVSQAQAEEQQEDDDEGWAELCYGSVETFVGSDIHKRALEDWKI